MSFPNSAIGLPASLDYKLPPSLPESAKATNVSVSPDGITSVTGPAIPTIFTNTTTNFGNYTSQLISFTIPSGMSDSVFMDCASTNLSFTMSYTVTTVGTATNPLFNLIGSGASWFDTLVLYSNNVPIEQVNLYGLLQNYLLNNTVSLNEKQGGISVSMGSDGNSASGLDLGTAVGTYRYNFCIPLLSVIGINSDKFFPVGSVQNLSLQLMTTNTYPLASYSNGAPTSAGAISGGITLSEFNLNMKYIDIGDVAVNLLKQTLVDGKWFIKSQTYTNSSVSLPTGSNGAQQLLLQIRNTSVKSIFHQFGIAQSAVCPNGYYDAVNPSLSSRQCQIGSQYFPNRPLNDLARPAESYPYLITAITQGGGLAKSMGTVVDRYTYNSVIPAVSGLPANSYDSYCVTPASGVRTAPAGSDLGSTNLIRFPNMAYYAYDLEKSSGILFQGLNTRSQPPFLNLVLAQATTSTVTCNAWGLSDVILSIDLASKQIQAFI